MKKNSTKTKKEIHIVSTYPTEGDGISKYVSCLLESIRERDYRVSTTCIYFLKNKFSTLKWIPLIFSSHSIVHLQYTPTGAGPGIWFYALFRSKKQRFVITAHELPSTYAKHLKGALKNIYSSFEKFIFHKCDSITVHTDQHRKEIINFGIAPEKIIVAEHPAFPPTESIKNPQPGHGVFFGKITPKKGLEVLFDALKQIDGDWTIDIIGPPAHGCKEYAGKLEQMVKSSTLLSDRVRFKGFVPDSDVGDVLGRASFAVFPYNYVTQSGALLTSVGEGLPYIASDLHVFSEFNKQHNGGMLFKAGDPESLAQCLQKAIMDQTLMEQLREEISGSLDELSWAKFADKILALYSG